MSSSTFADLQRAALAGDQLKEDADTIWQHLNHLAATDPGTVHSCTYTRHATRLAFFVLILVTVCIVTVAYKKFIAEQMQEAKQASRRQIEQQMQQKQRTAAAAVKSSDATTSSSPVRIQWTTPIPCFAVLTTILDTNTNQLLVINVCTADIIPPARTHNGIDRSSLLADFRADAFSTALMSLLVRQEVPLLLMSPFLI